VNLVGSRGMSIADYHFASDNTVGLHPEAWAHLEAANRGAVSSYGEDPYTAEACDAVREIFDRDAAVYFVFNGTAANSLALATLCQPYQSVIVSRIAHAELDECGAPEFFSGGSKLLLAGEESGKILPGEIERLVTQRTDIHYPKVRALSLTQPTEVGTVYSLEELGEIRRMKEWFNLALHMDGARFAQAVASLGVAPGRIIEAAGVDVLSFGLVKLGLGFAEMVVFFNRALGEDFAYRCKQGGQLASKMRFAAAPVAPMLRSGRWLQIARHANGMARELSAGLQSLEVPLCFPVEANGVFVSIASTQAERLRQRGWRFYDFIGGSHRLMCHWATDRAMVQRFLGDVQAS